jgi:hypothetical protein
MKDHAFMFTKISGDVNDQNLKQHVLDLNRETEGISNLRERADCRVITDMERLSVQGTADCARLESNRPHSLLAIFVTDSTLLYGMARAYQVFSEDRRKGTKIFKNLDDALAWLANDDQEARLFYDFINMHKK